MLDKIYNNKKNNHKTIIIFSFIISFLICFIVLYLILHIKSIDKKEIEEFINLTITEHMGKSYADWKLSQPSVTEPDEIEEAYKKVIETLSAEQEEVITKYCDVIFSSGAEAEEFFYRLGLRDGLKLRKVIKSILKSFL